MAEPIDINGIIKLRHQLHSLAELSGQEKQTADKIKQELKQLPFVEIVENIGGYGVAGIINSGKPGKTYMFRAELDALPVEENLNTDYVSNNPQMSHKCGHDGHMAILLGLGRLLSANRKLWKGKVILMFQPAEETGTGARLVIEDDKFNILKPDFVFALHNLPGFPLHSIITRSGLFTSSSQGLIIKLQGRTSHAGHPEQGNSPLIAMINILTFLNSVKDKVIGCDRSALVTIIHLQLGERSFGTNPGEGKIMITLRAHHQEDLNLLKTAITDKVNCIAKAYNLEVKLDWVEYFPEVCNHKLWVDRIIQTAVQLDLKIINRKQPFAWTEDFAYFTRKIPGVMLGLGAGEDYIPLHDKNYDFPDSLIPTGIDLWWNLILNDNNQI
jgi:amidohydrolase